MPTKEVVGSKSGRVDSGEGCPFPLETFTALRNVLRSGLWKTPFFQATFRACGCAFAVHVQHPARTAWRTTESKTKRPKLYLSHGTLVEQPPEA